MCACVVKNPALCVNPCNKILKQNIRKDGKYELEENNK